MVDAGFLELVIRSVVSLAIVLAVVAVAYQVARRRNSGGSSRTFGRSGGGRSSATRSPAALETVARVGLSRGSAAVAVRFADQVVLLGITEGAPVSVLHEMSAERWDAIAAVDDVVSTPIPTPGAAGSASAPERPGFVEALREATARRG
ncbi:flagellar biosynthetic protein FliO [Ilumatobacter sp.]|uniref:flagellar biosynthetic protein FliO n=1 Tax=Ilumatobacter sp. TaxID=1967498 RepID=UPI003B52282F